jgi:hypothetical protein
MAIVAVLMVATAGFHLASQPAKAPDVTTADPRFVLYAVLGVAMVFYAWVGVSRFANREPQVVIDRDGMRLGFGRNRRIAWSDIQWVRLRRLGFRPQLQIGIVPDAFVAADLRLSMWSLDDGLRPIRGVPAAVAVRDNGLDARASAMLDSVKSIRPNLVKP